MKNVLIAETSNHKILLYAILHVCPLVSIFALLPGRYLGSAVEPLSNKIRNFCSRH